MGDDAGQAHRTTQKAECEQRKRGREERGTRWTASESEVGLGIAKKASRKRNDTHLIESSSN